MAIPPSAFFFVLTALANFGLLCLHSKFEIILSMSVEKGHGVLIMVALNLYITCGSMAIFTIVILPTRDHRRSFQFLASSSISFFGVSEFSWKRSTVSLARLQFHCCYCLLEIIWVAIMNRILCFISFLTCLPLATKKARKFLCMFLLYPTTLLKVFVSFKSIFLWSL